MTIPNPSAIPAPNTLNGSRISQISGYKNNSNNASGQQRQNRIQNRKNDTSDIILQISDAHCKAKALPKMYPAVILVVTKDISNKMFAIVQVNVQIRAKKVTLDLMSDFMFLDLLFCVPNKSIF